ncbi:hypothetical protein F2Q70_00008144 [Brassica cretica]|uniref:Uncharacterized protein n=1 Tax=Brassica cretica TaxID=69181 RepID=A0A8S9M4K0_BRACR|nr:hypothetical protein F2Q70_00008144 [Brassica cretica]
MSSFLQRVLWMAWSVYGNCNLEEGLVYLVNRMNGAYVLMHYGFKFDGSMQNQGEPILAASLLSTTDCLSQKQRRWGEDMVWHPSGHTLFSVYTADDGDSQISILNLNKTPRGNFPGE